MGSRTNKILKMAFNESNHILNLPKYETTKGTSREEQLLALASANKILNIKQSYQPHDFGKKETVITQKAGVIEIQNGVGKHKENNNKEQNHDTDTSEEPFLSSSTEYIPDTSDGGTSEEDDVFDKNIFETDTNQLPSTSGYNDRRNQGVCNFKNTVKIENSIQK